MVHIYSEKRPWGFFVILDEGKGYKVKNITVNAGQKLSLQFHKFRSEHWTVVQGVATATVGDFTNKFNINESLFIPQKMKHSLANDENEALIIIEVQIGDYLGEDDIVRLEDRYGRK
tara:strand:- start:216 stop:566 length:351 start_codon:yes stop_codon:yes gene_type:complete